MHRQTHKRLLNRKAALIFPIKIRCPVAMKIVTGHLFFIAILCLLATPEKVVAIEDAPVLKKLLVKDEEKKIKVIIEGSSSELSPTIFRLSDPMRLVVDLAGVRPGPFKGKMTLRKDPIIEITTIHKGKPGELTRIEIFLTGPVDVSHTSKENQLIIELSKSLIEKGEWAKKEEVLEKPPLEEVKKEVVVRPEVIAKEKEVEIPDSRPKTNDRKEKVKVKGPVKPVHLRILITGSLDEAREILSEIKKGRPFAILARERSIDEKTKKEGGYIGKTDGKDLPAGIREAMAGLKEGEVSDLILLEDGRYAIIQVITLRYYAEGMKAFRKGDYKEAEKAFKRHLELNPDGTKSYLRLGEIYEDRGDFKGAEEMYRNAIGFDPSLEEAYIRLEALYLKTGEKEKAKEISEKRSSLERKGRKP